MQFIFDYDVGNCSFSDLVAILSSFLCRVATRPLHSVNPIFSTINNHFFRTKNKTSIKHKRSSLHYMIYQDHDVGQIVEEAEKLKRTLQRRKRDLEQGEKVNHRSLVKLLDSTITYISRSTAIMKRVESESASCSPALPKFDFRGQQDQEFALCVIEMIRSCFGASNRAIEECLPNLLSFLMGTDIIFTSRRKFQRYKHQLHRAFMVIITREVGGR